MSFKSVSSIFEHTTLDNFCSDELPNDKIKLIMMDLLSNNHIDMLRHEDTPYCNDTIAYSVDE